LASLPLGQWAIYALLALTMLTPFVLSACGNPPAKPAETAEEDASAEEDTEEEGSTTPKVVLETHLRYSEVGDFHPRALQWVTKDGFILKGALYSPTAEVEALAQANKPVGEVGEEGEEEDPEALAEEEVATDAEEDGEDAEAVAATPPKHPLPKYRYPLVVLTHRLSSTGKRLSFLVPDLVKAGYGVLVLDLRGHGHSDALRGGGVQSWRTFEKSEWKNLVSDFRVIEQYFEHPDLNQATFPWEIIPKRMAIMAEGISANALLLRSADQDADLKAVISIGATLESKGLNPVLSVMHSKIPTLYMASQSEPMSYEDTQQLYRITEATKSLHLYEDVGLGMDILKSQPSAQKEVLQWIEGYMHPANLDPAFKQALRQAKASWEKQARLPKKTPKTEKKSVKSPLPDASDTNDTI
jgi:hypothetical protein